MHPITNEQREALMALKDGPLPSEIFNAAHNDPSVSELFPDLVETGHSEIDDGIQAVVTLTENGHIALLSLLRETAVAQASSMRANDWPSRRPSCFG